MTATAEQGFTLIETLVATTVLAVAASGLIQAAGSHIDTIRYLETRSIAQWVAENRLVELGLPRSTPLPATVRSLDRVWRMTTSATATHDPDLVAVEVAVRSGDGGDGSVAVGASGSGSGSGGNTSDCRSLIRLRGFEARVPSR